MAAHAADYDVYPDDIIVAGDSAGGNLAAVTALRARDEGGPRLRGQILIYPVIDPAARLPSRSEGHVITAAALDWFWDQYLPSSAVAEHPYAVPSKADLRGLPPTLILTTEHEVYRDEAENYGDMLRAAGVETETARFDGLIHGVFWMSGAVPRSRELRDAVGEFVTRVGSPSRVG